VKTLSSLGFVIFLFSIFWYFTAVLQDQQEAAQTEEEEALNAGALVIPNMSLPAFRKWDYRYVRTGFRSVIQVASAKQVPKKQLGASGWIVLTPLNKVVAMVANK
jgi:hypothetical protein